MLSYDLGSINMINLNIYVMFNVQRESIFFLETIFNDIIWIYERERERLIERKKDR